jgi:hypothetical protein
MTTTSLARPVIRRLRQVLVLMHVATAFGWLATSAALLLLIGHALGLEDPAAQRDVLAVAAHLDDNMLADLSFMTVYTGLMLAGLTPWGYTRFWWSPSSSLWRFPAPSAAARSSPGSSPTPPPRASRSRAARSC